MAANFKEYLEEEVPGRVQGKIQRELGFTDYSWTWFTKRPEKFSTEHLAIIARILKMEWKELYQSYRVAAEQLDVLEASK